ncbi:hypothetical protein [Streptomyces sp. NPDC051576]|uniref:GAP1-N2 domain-containing protein n=1 Tax=Streptomyces sp. NPDC051576 TaxID=3155803 RepID=UPI0034465630
MSVAVTRSVEQLHYTWALSGLDRSAGFQRVAASPALAAGRSASLAAALALCRYSRPLPRKEDEEPPVSFGWTDLGELRLVFHRTYAGRDGGGRPGNFRAHVLVGPRAELPVSELALRHASDFWWRATQDTPLVADDEERHLPRISLDDIPHGPPLAQVDRDEIAPFLDAVLTAAGRAPACLRRRPEIAVALTAKLEHLLPGAAERFSFSTYETGRAVKEFGIVGITAREQTPHGAVIADLPDDTRPGRTAEPRATVRPAVAALRDLLLDPDAVDRSLLRVAAVYASDGQGRPSLATLPEGLAFARSLERGVRPDPALVVRCLADPPTAGHLMRLPEARAACAEALASGDDSAWTSLAAGLGGVPDEQQRLLAHDVADRPTGGRADTLVARLHPARTEFARACLGELLSAAALGALTSVRPDTRLSLLQHAERHPPLPEGTAYRLIRDSGASFSTIAADKDLPTAWRAAALNVGIAQRDAESEHRVRAFLDADPALVTPLALALSRPELLLDVLTGPDIEPQVCAAARELDPPGRFRLLSSYGKRLGPAGALAFFARQHPRSRLRPTASEWNAPLAADMADFVSARLHGRVDASPIPSPEVIGLLSVMPAGPAQAWAVLLTHLHPYEPDRPITLSEVRTALGPALAQLDPTARQTAFDLALRCWFMRSEPGAAELRDLIVISGEGLLTAHTVGVLKMSYRAALHGYPTAVPSALGCVALLIEDGRLGRRLFGTPDAERLIDRLAVELARMSPSGLGSALPEGVLRGHRARTWWKRITKLAASPKTRTGR